ncbi:MAG: hypothetical protein AWU57_4540, partial [Marinobacter sp. T13-3]
MKFGRKKAQESPADADDVKPKKKFKKKNNNGNGGNKLKKLSSVAL